MSSLLIPRGPPSRISTKLVEDDNGAFDLLFSRFSNVLSRPSGSDAELSYLWNDNMAGYGTNAIEFSDTSNRLADVGLSSGVDWDRAAEILPPRTSVSQTPNGSSLTSH